MGVHHEVIIEVRGVDRGAAGHLRVRHLGTPVRKAVRKEDRGVLPLQIPRPGRDEPARPGLRPLTEPDAASVVRAPALFAAHRIDDQHVDPGLWERLRRHAPRSYWRATLPRALCGL